MKTNIRGDKVEITESMKNYIEEKLAKLSTKKGKKEADPVGCCFQPSASGCLGTLFP